MIGGNTRGTAWLAGLCLLLISGVAQASTLAEIRERGYVRCGFRPGSGLVQTDATGRLSGFMVDFCRVIAAAVLGDAEAIQAKRLPDKPEEFRAVEEHEVDISLQNTTWTLSREARYAVAFTVPVYYDGQGFAVATDRKTPPPLRQLGARTVCVKSDTTTQRNLQDFILQEKLPWTLRLFRTWDEALQAFLGRECQIVTTDRSVLLASLNRYRVGANPVHVYPDIISREPLTPYVAAGDPNWADIVRWCLFATIRAEEKGISSQNLLTQLDSPDPEIRRMLGRVPGLGAKLGLPDDWVVSILRQVGNYGEIFDRNLGRASPYRMERGLNQIRSKGGQLMAPLFQ